MTDTPLDVDTTRAGVVRGRSRLSTLALVVIAIALVVIAYATVRIAHYERQQVCYADIATFAAVAAQNGRTPRDIGIHDSTPAKCRNAGIWVGR